MDQFKANYSLHNSLYDLQQGLALLKGIVKYQEIIKFN